MLSDTTNQLHAWGVVHDGLGCRPGEGLADAADRVIADPLAPLAPLPQRRAAEILVKDTGDTPEEKWSAVFRAAAVFGS